MALVTVTGGGKGVLAVMTGAAGLSFHHGPHAEMFGAMFEREEFGVALGAFVHPQVNLVAENSRSNSAVGKYEGHIAGDIACMTLGALSGHGKGVLAVVTGAASAATFHGSHGDLKRSVFEGEEFRMTDVTFVIHPQVDLVTEEGRGSLLAGYGKGYLFRGHPFVTTTAVGRHGKGALAVMADAAFLPLLHLGHGDVVLTGDDGLAVMTALAFAGGLGDVEGVTEGRILNSLCLEDDITGFSFMAANARFFVGDAECLHTGVAGAASLGLFHHLHGVMPLLPDVEDGVVAHLAVTVDVPRLQVKVVTEDNLVGILEVEFDVLGFGGKTGMYHGQGDENRQGREQNLHYGLLLQGSNPKPVHNTVNLLVRQPET